MVAPRIKKEVLEFTKKIPKGKVTSYKELARILRIHPRSVARALACNPHPVKIPCHRVVHADGKIGGYTPKGQKEKVRLLEKEGVKIIDGKAGKNYFYFFKA